jgi:S1-C subfamily serine protease
MKRTMSMLLAAVAAGALAGGVVAALVEDGDASPSAPPIPAQPAGVATDGALTPQQIYARDTPGVVVITATETKKIPATVFAPAQSESVESLGSGFVIDKKGDILTNQHVTAGSSGIRVGFSGGATYPATVVGADASTDLAVVRVKVAASALHPVGFDDSAAARGGDPVYAIGNPFGLDRTMTTGIVSATGRDIDAPNGVSIPKAIQTDVPSITATRAARCSTRGAA